MGYVRISVFVLVVLAFGILSHSASATCTKNPCTYTNGNNSVKVTYYAIPQPPATSPLVTAVSGGTTTCPPSKGCGYALVWKDATTVNWQSGKLPSGGSNPLTFTLGSGAALHAYDQYAPCTFCTPTMQNPGGLPEPWRSPLGDYGYILSTYDTSTSSSGIIIKPTTAGEYFSALSFYWGSVDPWNTVVFTDATGNGDTVYITGSNLQSQGVCVPSVSSCGNTAHDVTDVVVYFQAGGDAWSKVQLFSCEATGTSGSLTTPCNPAFEIDNLQYTVTSTKAPVSFGDGNQSPVPEPTGLLLMSTGIIGISGWLRRRVRP